MSRVKRKPSKLRRMERRAQQRARRDGARDRYVAAHVLDQLNRMAAFERQESRDGLVVCEECFTVQPYEHAERHEDDPVSLAPCLRGVLLDLPCAGETAISLEHFAEAL